MKKPGTLIAIQVMAWVAIGGAALFYFFIFLILFIKGTPQSHYSEFRSGIIDGLVLHNPNIHLDSVYRAFGYLFFFFFIRVIKYGLVLVFIHNKLFKSLLVTLIVIIFFDLLLNQLSMLYPLAMLIIVLAGINNIKDYMRKPPVNTESTIKTQ